MSYNYSKQLKKPNVEVVKDQQGLIPAINKLIEHAKQNSPSIEQELVAIEKHLHNIPDSNASGTFLSGDTPAKVVTVENGIITRIA